MAVPSVLYLRQTSGQAIGPIPRMSVEVLFDSRVVDENTQISADGETFTPLQKWPEMLMHLEEVKEALSRGEDPWAEDAEASEVPSQWSRDKTVVGQMVRQAVAKATGLLRIRTDDGEITLTYKDGKVASVETDIDDLSVAAFLVQAGACDQATITEGLAHAPNMGGDLGGALIALGRIEPHVYFEKFVAWAKHVLGAAVARPTVDIEFQAEDVANPPFPLGFDRLGVAIEAVRAGMTRARLTELMVPKRPCPLIISQIDGAALEDMKLKPRELRALNAVDGVKTLGDLIDDLGGSEDKSLPILQATFFAEQAGFIVLGDDPMRKKELAEAQVILQEFQTLEKKNYFEMLDVTETSTDEEVRARFADFAKKYHPDKIRAEATAELLEARRKIFDLLSMAAEALETEDQRYKYAHDLEQGIVGGQDAVDKVQAALHAETLFKKAEILQRVRKYDEAIVHLDEAIALEPNDVEFQILREYLGYLQGSKRGEGVVAAEKAVSRILAIMKNNANIASGYLFLGHLQTALGKEDLALRYFEKVLEYDEHHPEAVRQVRVGRMRKEKKKKKRWL